MLGHVLNVVAVLDESVSHDTLVERGLESFCENLWVLIIEDDKNSMKTTFFFGVLPETVIALSFGTEAGDANSSPVAKVVLVTP